MKVWSIYLSAPGGQRHALVDSARSAAKLTLKSRARPQTRCADPRQVGGVRSSGRCLLDWGLIHRSFEYEQILFVGIVSPQRESIMYSKDVSLLLALIAMPVILSSQAMAGVSPYNKFCLKAYNDWKKKSGHKAFAISPSSSPMGQNCGYSWSAPSKRAAERDALKYCAKGKWGIGVTCYILESK